MKICAAQIKPLRGDVPGNLSLHLQYINQAADAGVELIFFPELSLTGYEPELAGQLAMSVDDERLDVLQQVSDARKIIIGAGLPTAGGKGVCITMIWFQPDVPRTAYSKQYLHEDELPYFVPGSGQVFLEHSGITLAPAICYESLLPHHAAAASAGGAHIYLASVAKNAKGVEKALKHYPAIAAQYKMPVIMANCFGFCDNFESTGNTAVWDSKGVLLKVLDDGVPGLVIFDTETEKAMIVPR